MKNLSPILFAFFCMFSAARAVEINERGQVIFKTVESRLVQYADALSITDIREDHWQASGDENAVAAISGTDRLRFYRMMKPGETSPAQYALGIVKLFPGKNWVGLWGDPEENTLKSLFGNRLPEGIVISTGQMEAGASAVEIELPAGSGPIELPVILRVPAELVTHIPFEKKALCGFRFAGPPQLDKTGLLEGGFTGGDNPKDSDQLWKYDREKQRAPFAVWYCTKDNTWRLTSPSDFPPVPENYFRYDDAVTVFSRHPNGIKWGKSGIRADD
ncbi:MAG: hypothetical protein AB7T27_04690 [Kiritimatiellia bacterium]